MRRSLWDRLANYFHWGYRISPLTSNRKAIEMMSAPVRLYRYYAAGYEMRGRLSREQERQYREDLVAGIMRQLLEQMARAEFINRGAAIRLEVDVRLKENLEQGFNVFELVAIVKDSR